MATKTRAKTDEVTAYWLDALRSGYHEIVSARQALEDAAADLRSLPAFFGVPYADRTKSHANIVRMLERSVHKLLKSLGYSTSSREEQLFALRRAQRLRMRRLNERRRKKAKTGRPKVKRSKK